VGKGEASEKKNGKKLKRIRGRLPNGSKRRGKGSLPAGLDRGAKKSVAKSGHETEGKKGRQSGFWADPRKSGKS